MKPSIEGASQQLEQISRELDDHLALVEPLNGSSPHEGCKL